MPCTRCRPNRREESDVFEGCSGKGSRDRARPHCRSWYSFCGRSRRDRRRLGGFGGVDADARREHTLLSRRRDANNFSRSPRICAHHYVWQLEPPGQRAEHPRASGALPRADCQCRSSELALGRPVHQLRWRDAGRPDFHLGFDLVRSDASGHDERRLCGREARNRNRGERPRPAVAQPSALRAPDQLRLRRGRNVPLRPRART